MARSHRARLLPRRRGLRLSPLMVGAASATGARAHASWRDACGISADVGGVFGRSVIVPHDSKEGQEHRKHKGYHEKGERNYHKDDERDAHVSRRLRIARLIFLWNNRRIVSTGGLVMHLLVTAASVSHQRNTSRRVQFVPPLRATLGPECLGSAPTRSFHNAPSGAIPTARFPRLRLLPQRRSLRRPPSMVAHCACSRRSHAMARSFILGMFGSFP